MKKLLLLLLALCLAVPLLVMTACGDDEEPTPTPAPAPAPCTHVDANYDDLCDLCGAQVSPHAAVYATDWTKDANGHYKAAICCDAHKAAVTSTPHTDANNDDVCDDCAYDFAPDVFFAVNVMAPYMNTYAKANSIQVAEGLAMTPEQIQSAKDSLYQGRGFATFWADPEKTTEFDFNQIITADVNIYCDFGDLAGRNITWAYDEATTTLTLTGSGAMFDFFNGTAVPWSGKTISNVVIDEKITSIGDYSFYVAKLTTGNGIYLSNVTLPAGLERIGEYAFYGENLLTEIDFPEALKVIDEHAFRACTGLTYIDIGGENLEAVNKSAFAQCSGATYLVFNSAIEGSAQVFESCTFKKAYFAGNKGQYESIEIGYGNSRLDLAYIFYYTSYEPQKAGPYWHRAEDGTPAQWCYSINYLPASSNGNLSIARDYVFVKNPVITQDNIDFRNNIWYEGYQFDSWTGNPTFALDTKLTDDVSYRGVRGSKVGDGVDFNITNGVLTISGSGKMWDFGAVDSAPWYEGSTYNISTITEIVIGSNVTYIGDYAFCSFPSLESVEIKNNIVEMSTKAFYGCQNLKYVYYHGNELEAKNCKGLQNQEDLPDLVVYCKEMAKDNVCDSCGYCMDADEDGSADHEDLLCDRCEMCFTHVDANDDEKCDVCDTCVGVDHKDEKSSNNKCFVCKTCVSHNEDSDSDGDGLCDTCMLCVGEHTDSDSDVKCDTCGACITHTDEANDGICDVCNKCVGAHVDKDGRCDACAACIQHTDAKADGVCDVCGKCSGEHVAGECDLCGGCIDHVDAKCDVCKVCKEHVDSNSDNKCDVCEKCMADAHTDNNSDGKCDACGSCMTHVDDVAANGKCLICAGCIEHKDANKDGKCDICAACMQCADADDDDDTKCDTCGICMATCADGEDADAKCDTCGKCLHVDSDANGLCDECGSCMEAHVNKDNKCDVCKECIEHSYGKCDVCARCADENHTDDNNDGKCDTCKACLDHIDADVTYLTGKGIAPTICYWKDIEVADGVVARITWQFDKETGVLTVGGEGAIKNFASLDDTPWAKTFSYATAESLGEHKIENIDVAVKKIVIRDGVTAIGDNAFSGITAAAELSIAGTVKQISASAFNGIAFCSADNYNDEGLLISGTHLIKVDPTKAGTRVLVPTQITTIADGAFAGCSAVTAIRVPNGLAGATEASYDGLTALTTVFVHTTETAWNNNATKDALPDNATLYFFSTTPPTTEGNFWYNLIDPTIWVADPEAE